MPAEANDRAAGRIYVQRIHMAMSNRMHQPLLQRHRSKTRLILPLSMKRPVAIGVHAYSPPSTLDICAMPRLKSGWLPCGCFEMSKGPEIRPRALGIGSASGSVVRLVHDLILGRPPQGGTQAPLSPARARLRQTLILPPRWNRPQRSKAAP